MRGGAEVPVKAACELGSLYSVQPRPERECFCLESLARTIDRRQKRCGRCRVTEGCFVRAHMLAQYSEVVIITKMIRELVGSPGELADGTGAYRFQNLQLMPQILYMLAPLMQSFDRLLPASVGKLATSARVRAFQPIAKDWPPSIASWPAYGGRVRSAEHATRLKYSSLCRHC